MNLKTVQFFPCLWVGLNDQTGIKSFPPRVTPNPLSPKRPPGLIHPVAAFFLSQKSVHLSHLPSVPRALTLFKHLLQMNTLSGHGSGRLSILFQALTIALGQSWSICKRSFQRMPSALARIKILIAFHVVIISHPGHLV